MTREELVQAVRRYAEENMPEGWRHAVVTFNIGPRLPLETVIVTGRDDREASSSKD